MKAKIFYFFSNLEKKKFYLLILLAASLPLSESIKEIAIFLSFLVFLTQVWRRELRWKLNWFSWGLFLLLGGAFISTLLAENWRRSLDGFNDFLFITAPFFVAQSLSDNKYKRAIIWTLGLAATCAAAPYIIKSYQLNKPLEIHALGNQNYTAMFLTIAFSGLLGFLCFSNQESKKERLILALCALILIWAAVMTVMRTSFLGLGVFLVLLFWHFRNDKMIRLIFISSLCILFLAILFVEPMREKLFVTSSLYARYEIWKHAWFLFKKNPIWGVGINNFSFTFPSNSPVDAGASYFDAHNLYLQTASQLGLVGLVAISMMIYGFLTHWLRVQPSMGINLATKYAALGAFCVIFIGGIFDHTLHHGHGIAFALLAGFLFNMGSQESTYNDVLHG